MPSFIFQVLFLMVNLTGVPSICGLVWYWATVVQKTNRVSAEEVYWCKVTVSILAG